MAKKGKPKTDMANVTKGYEAFIKGKKLNKGGKKYFEKTSAAAVKPRSSK